jgi:hypothetical protein
MLRQHGGALEPIQKVPPFHYTESEARKIWTRALYPYAPYFFAMLNEIPWKSFKYEDDDILVKNPKVPYLVGGGSALELIDAEYSKFLPIRLHDFVDPTGDIDVWVRPPILTPKHGELNINPFKSKKGNSIELTPWAEAYIDWLFNAVVRFIESLSYNFKAWYGDTLVDYSPERNASIEGITIQDLTRVGPFSIFKHIEQVNNTTADIRIQVCTAIQTSSGETYNSHFIELLIFYNEPEEGMLMSDNNILIESIQGQMDKNFDSIINRIDWVNDYDDSHKLLNHLYRGIFLINLFSMLRKTESQKENEDRKVYDYTRSINILLDKIIKTKKETKIRGQEKLELLIPALIQVINYYPVKYRRTEDNNFEELLTKVLKVLNLSRTKHRNLNSNSILTYKEYKNTMEGGGHKRRSTRRHRKSKLI